MRDKLIEFIRKADKEDYESRTQDEHYAAMADRLIAEGVTIPVLCKHCKWWIEWTCTNKNGANCMVVNGDWFCAAGERKDDD